MREELSEQPGFSYEDAELLVLVGDAFDVRGTEAFPEAVGRLGDWLDRRPVERCRRFLELEAGRRNRRAGELVSLLRETL